MKYWKSFIALVTYCIFVIIIISVNFIAWITERNYDLINSNVGYDMQSGNFRSTQPMLRYGLPVDSVEEKYGKNHGLNYFERIIYSLKNFSINNYTATFVTSIMIILTSITKVLEFLIVINKFYPLGFLRRWKIK